MTPIHASDQLAVPYPMEQVWAVLTDVAGYARWWPPSIGLRVLSGGTEPLGTEVEVKPAGGRAFRCRVEVVDAPRRMCMRYYGGLVEGFGEWRLEPSETGTRVSYDLDAEARGWLVALLNYFVDLGAVHSRQMKGVLRGLERALLEGRSVAGRS